MSKHSQHHQLCFSLTFATSGLNAHSIQGSFYNFAFSLNSMQTLRNVRKSLSCKMRLLTSSNGGVNIGIEMLLWNSFKPSLRLRTSPPRPLSFCLQLPIVRHSSRKKLIALTSLMTVFELGKNKSPLSGTNMTASSVGKKCMGMTEKLLK